MARRSTLLIEGWGILICVPALLCLAYFFPIIPFISDAPLCGVRTFLGFECPGCGLTMSFVELMHGKIRSSINAHPLGIVIMLWMIYMFARAVLTLILGRIPKPLLTQKQRDIALYAFLVALIGQWLIKLGIGTLL